MNDMIRVGDVYRTPFGITQWRVIEVGKCNVLIQEANTRQAVKRIVPKDHKILKGHLLKRNG